MRVEHGDAGVVESVLYRMPMTTPNSLNANDFRIEKSLLPVSITLVDGEILTGDLYIQASAKHLFAKEDASEVMNAAESFFPLRLKSGSTLLVAKEQVRDVRVAREQLPADDVSVGIPTPVHCRLRDGSNIEGKLVVEFMAGRGRVLDHLNRASERFITLHRSEGVVLVNRSQIVHVRQLIDATA